MSETSVETLGPLCRRACDELTAVLARMPAAALEDTCAELAAATRIALHGVGREGLMMKALAMRLYHLGLDAHPVGDMTTPPLGGGDLLMVSAGPGQFATVEALMNVARGAGARTLLFTSADDAPLGALADRTILIPARTMAVSEQPADTVLPMGSAYEGAQFLYFELVVRALRERLGRDEAAMRSRHTNLE